MSLTSTTNRADFGVTSATNFPYNFKVFDATDLEVYRTDSTGVQTLVSPALYTVNGVGTETGSIDYATHDATDLGLVILRVVDETQPTVLRGQSTFYADVVEKALDRLVMISQQIRETFNRTLKMPVGFTGSTTLPGAQEGYVLGWVGGVLTNLSAATSQLAADLLSSVVGKGAALVTYLSSLTGAVARTQQSKNEDTLDMRDFGLVVDGLTDQTATINAKLAALGAAGFRGWIKIPYNTKFDVPTVYAAVPTGIILDDESSINWGQPPSYKNKFRIMYSGDLVADDTQQVIASGHHPALMLLNMGTAGSTAASSRYGSILHGVGKDTDGDPLLGWLFQFAKHPSLDKWRAMYRLETPYLVAMGNPTPWTTGQVVAAGAYRTSDGGKVYKTSAGGTCGVTAPTGTGTGINDGAVLWDYVQAAIALDTSRWDIDEDGNMGMYGPAGSALEHTMQSGSRSMVHGINSSTNDVYWRDVSRGADVLRSSDTKGIQFGAAQSPNRLALTGATFNAPVTGAGKVTQGGATNVTTMNRISGRTNMVVTLRFDDANSTLVHAAATDKFILKGAINVNPPARSFMTFEMDTSDTGVWVESHRSF